MSSILAQRAEMTHEIKVCSSKMTLSCSPSAQAYIEPFAVIRLVKMRQRLGPHALAERMRYMDQSSLRIVCCLSSIRVRNCHSHIFSILLFSLIILSFFLHTWLFSSQSSCPLAFFSSYSVTLAKAILMFKKLSFRCLLLCKSHSVN